MSPRRVDPPPGHAFGRGHGQGGPPAGVNPPGPPVPLPPPTPSPNPPPAPSPGPDPFSLPFIGVGVSPGFGRARDLSSGWTTDEGPGRKVWGGGGSSPPPSSCALVLSRIVEPFGDSGDRNVEGSFSYQPPAPPTLPSIIIVTCVASEGTGFVTYGGGNPNPGAPYTLSDSISQGSGVHTIGTTNYLPQASAGLPPAFVSPSFLGSGGFPCERAVSASFVCSSTAPVQQAAQVGSGAIATFPSLPTPGNFLFLAKIGETTNGVPFTPPPRFTVLYDVHMTGPTIGIGGVEILIMGACVEVGDTQSYFTGDLPFAHWGFLTEWAL